MKSPLFSIIIPTTGDRGPLLPFAVRSILNQSIQSLEVFIIGDGLDISSSRIAADLSQSDSRVHFYPFPKGMRRGEQYRDQVLKNHAKGTYISYLCDRDLMLPEHLATSLWYLKKNNFVASSVLLPTENGKLLVQRHKGMYYGHIKRPTINLSAVIHSLNLYKSLPQGWSTTPVEEEFTDRYMWKKFLINQNTRSYYYREQTILYFKRGDHPGLATEERVKEIKAYQQLMTSASWTKHLNEHLIPPRSGLLERSLAWKGLYDLKQFFQRSKL